MQPNQTELRPARMRRLSRAIERAMSASDIPGVRVVEICAGVAATAVGLPATDETLAALEAAWNGLDTYEEDI